VAALQARNVDPKGLAQLIRAGTSLTVIWSISTSEQAEFAGATSRPNCERSHSRRTRPYPQPAVHAWITHSKHGHDLWIAAAPSSPDTRPAMKSASRPTATSPAGANLPLTGVSAAKHVPDRDDRSGEPCGRGRAQRPRRQLDHESGAGRKLPVLPAGDAAGFAGETGDAQPRERREPTLESDVPPDSSTTSRCWWNQIEMRGRRVRMRSAAARLRGSDSGRGPE